MVSEKFTDKIKTLAAAKAKVAELQQALVHELREEFAALHSRFGFSDRQTFLDAVKKHAGDQPSSRRRRRSARKATKAPPVRRAKKSRKVRSKK